MAIFPTHYVLDDQWSSGSVINGSTRKSRRTHGSTSSSAIRSSFIGGFLDVIARVLGPRVCVSVAGREHAGYSRTRSSSPLIPTSRRIRASVPLGTSRAECIGMTVRTSPRRSRTCDPCCRAMVKPARCKARTKRSGRTCGSPPTMRLESKP